MLLFVALFAAIGAPPEPGSSTSFTVPATGRQQAVFTAAQFGRYAFEVASPSGASVQLVDRMTGPGALDGQPGERDGRVDAFLDQGQIKLVVRAPVDGEGEAQVSVTRFERLGDTPALPRAQQVTTRLADRQERAWWIEVDKRESTSFEAVGRSLADLRIWQHGTWLVDARPSCTIVEPSTGQPARRCALATSLEPGLYQLVAYGGPPQAWAESGPEDALYTQWELPSLAPAGREPRRIGPTGTDRMWVPAGVDFAQVDLAEVAPLILGGRSYGSGGAFGAGGATAEISDESRVPRAQVRLDGSTAGVISVQGTPGQAYTLTWFDRNGPITNGSGPTYLTTLHAADLADIPTPSPLLYRSRTDRFDVVAHSGIPLSPKVAHQERFNLLGPTSILLDVKKTARYRIATSGTSALMRVRPYWISAPTEYQAPPQVLDEWDDTLDAGLHILELTPVDEGIVELKLGPNGWTDWARSALTGGPAEAAPMPELRHVLDGPFRSMGLRPTGIPDVARGVVIRPLPLDPTQSVPVALTPGEVYDLPIRVGRAGTLDAMTEAGTPLEVVLEQARAASHRLAPGSYKVGVANPTDQVVRGSLRFTPDAVPLTPPPASILSSLPKFPQLRADKPASTDLDASESETWAVTVAEPGLYRLQSTGLLATEGGVRTRTRLGLASGDRNGVGRNFLVARYLREGDYQLTVSPTGKSEGHIGLVLDRTRVVDGGELAADLPARVSLPAGDAVRYRITVPEAGRYRIRSFGPGRTFECRLEDDDGWPLTTPGGQCELDESLAAGSYVIIGLPEQVPTRRMTTLTPVRGATTLEGHGPHPLPLGTTVSHVWSEPVADGAERTPDTWTFTLPAPAIVTLRSGDEMAGRVTGSAGEVGRIVPGRSLVTALEAGDYTVALTSARRSTGVPYTLTVEPRELIAGITREVDARGSHAVSVGQPGLITLASTGSIDVRARLVDATGAVVASNDDRPDDWNFRLSAWLAPGAYTLRVEPVSGHSGSTTIQMTAPTARSLAAMATGERRTVSPGGAGVLMPLTLSDGADLVRATARSSETVAVAVEIDTGDGWRTVGTATGRPADLAVRRPHGLPTRLRVWSLDGGRNPVTVSVDASRPRAVREPGLATGVGAGAGVLLSGERPGLLAVTGSRRGVRVCPERGAPCVPAGSTVPLTEDGLILLGDRVRAERLELTESVPMTLGDRALAVDLPRADATALIVRGATGWPGASVGGTVGVGDKAALVLALDGERRARLWRASDGPALLDVRARAVPLALRDAAAARPARQTWTLPPRSASRVMLPADVVDLLLTLEAGTAASVGDRLAWADTRPREVALAGARSLTLVNLDDAERLVAADVLDASGAPALAHLSPSERWMPRAGSSLRRVPADAEGTVEVIGAQMRFVRDDGRVYTEPGAPVGPGGVLDLTWEPGPVLAWVARGESGPQRTSTAAPTVRVEAARRVALAGAAQALDLDLPADQVVHLTASCPYVAEIRPPDGPPRVVVRERGGSLDAWLPTGRARITLRALEGAALFGEARIITSVVEPLTEGLGPEVLLAPGASRWFRFHADRDGPVGVGVKAAADRVLARVVALDGRVVGSGVVRRVELTAGDWLLALEQPADAAPVRARPVIAGLDAPDHGPPDAVVQTYLERAAEDAQ
ncbi:MAG: hypothetical protein ACI8PZ_002614 [Myxococcota bacterium]|jgi:hypothetical protein